MPFHPDGYSTQEAEIYPRSACPDDFIGCKTDLLLIDPPGFQAELPFLGTLLSLCAFANNVILWIPVATVNGKETKSSVGAYEECVKMGLPIITVVWGVERSTKGCRIVFKVVPNARRPLLQAIIDISKAAGWDYYSSLH